MRNTKTLITILSSSAVVALTFASSTAFAQSDPVPVPLTLDPGSIDDSEINLSDDADDGGFVSGGDGVSGGAGEGPNYSSVEGAAPGSVDAEPENFYYGDYLDGGSQQHTNRQARRNNGIVPATHTVRSGDTLWDLSSYYFSDAWHWPKVWGLNPEISNPHWIYPGNIVRLRHAGAHPESVDIEPEHGFTSIATKAPQRSIGFHQGVYVDSQDLKDSLKVDGATDAKVLLAAGDAIYVSYPDGKLPKVGETFQIYTNEKEIERNGETAGAYVSVKGELEITFAKKGKRARAVITRSTNPIERGMRIGPLKLRTGPVEPVPNSTKVDGSIVKVIGPDELIGASSAVLINRGSNDGVEQGNRFLVLRRGDAYQLVMRPSSNVAMDDVKYPARAIGEVIVIQAGKAASLGLVTFSIQEFEPGDRVYMRKGQ